MKKKDCEYVGWEFNETYQAIYEIKKALKRMGLYVYLDPLIFPGSTFSGILISKNKLERKEVREKCKDSTKRSTASPKYRMSKK